MDEGLSIIVAAAMAILGIFYTSRQQRKLLRKQHTFQIIDRLNGWKELEDCVEHAAKLIKAGKVPCLGVDDHADDCAKVEFLLNYYEVLASAVICGDIDEELLRRMERGRLTRTYLRFLPYIVEVRDDDKNIRLWENLEFITYRWEKGQHDNFDVLLDRIMLRPTIQNLEQRREEVAAYLWAQRDKL